MDATTMVGQLDDLLGQIEPKVSVHSGRYWFQGTTAEQMGMRTRAVAAIERLTPRGSRYAQDATTPDILGSNPGMAVPKLAGVLRALRDDIAAGYMRTVEELIHADVFADFLEMAEELLAKKFKDPAAVLAGSVLEEHMRKLAKASGVAIESAPGKPKNADTINAELVKASVYNKLDQKSVTAWLGLRNNAAHGHYDQYDAGQVEGLIRDVRAFMLRYPA